MAKIIHPHPDDALEFERIEYKEQVFSPSEISRLKEMFRLGIVRPSSLCKVYGHCWAEFGEAVDGDVIEQHDVCIRRGCRYMRTRYIGTDLEMIEKLEATPTLAFLIQELREGERYPNHQKRGEAV